MISNKDFSEKTQRAYYNTYTPEAYDCRYAVLEYTYEVNSTIISLGFRVSYFAGNLCSRKINKSQTNQENIMGVQYNYRGSTGIGVNFVLSFSSLSICDTYHIYSFSMAAASCCHCCDSPLQSCVQLSSCGTVDSILIPYPICWAGRFFVGRYSTIDGVRAIGSAISVLPSGTPYEEIICLYQQYTMCDVTRGLHLRAYTPDTITL